MQYMSAIFGLVTLFLLLFFFSVILSKMTKLRICFASSFTAFFFTIPTSAYLTGLLLPKTELTGLALTETDKWMGGAFICGVVVVYVFWLFLFQPPSLETMFRKKVMDDALKDCDDSIRNAKIEIVGVEKNTEKYKDKLEFIKQLRLKKKQIKRTYRLGTWYGKIIRRVQGEYRQV